MIDLRVSCFQGFGEEGDWFVWRPRDRTILFGGTVKDCLRWRHTWGRSVLAERQTDIFVPEETIAA